MKKGDVEITNKLNETECYYDIKEIDYLNPRYLILTKGNGKFIAVNHDKVVKVVFVTKDEM